MSDLEEEIKTGIEILRKNKLIKAADFFDGYLIKQKAIEDKKNGKPKKNRRK